MGSFVFALWITRPVAEQPPGHFVVRVPADPPSTRGGIVLLGAQPQLGVFFCLMRTAHGFSLGWVGAAYASCMEASAAWHDNSGHCASLLDLYRGVEGRSPSRSHFLRHGFVMVFNAGAVVLAVDAACPSCSAGPSDRPSCWQFAAQQPSPAGVPIGASRRGRGAHACLRQQAPPVIRKRRMFWRPCLVVGVECTRAGDAAAWNGCEPLTIRLALLDDKGASDRGDLAGRGGLATSAD